MSSSLVSGVGIITGAGSGIGAAAAEDLATAGMRVTLVGRRADRLEAVAARIGAAGGESIPEPGDIRDYAAMQAIVGRTLARWGRVDVLVANAAAVEQSTISEGDPARWREVIETNVNGTLNTIRAVLPIMHEQGRGHIVIVASVSGRVTYVGEPAYVASKHALVAIGECLRQELIPKTIRVTLIEPALVATEFSDTEYVRTKFRDVVALSPAAVARTIRFALEQPIEVSISEIVIRPTNQL